MVFVVNVALFLLETVSRHFLRGTFHVTTKVGSQ